MSDDTDDLRALAAACSVATEFWDWRGEHVLVPEHTVRAVLAAMGIDTSTPEAVRRELRDRELAPWREMLPPCIVARDDRPAEIRVYVDHGVPVELSVVLEEGGVRNDAVQQDVWLDPREVDGRWVGVATFRLPHDMPLGWHRVKVRTPSRSAECPLVITPSWLGLPAALEGRRIWGLTAQLYSVRSQRSWGLGDLADLRDLSAWAARGLGAGFVLVNPLHAASVVAPMEASPYLPVTRRFVNPVYLRVEDVPEFAYLSPEDFSRVVRLGADLKAGQDDEDTLLDRDRVWAAKLAALEIVAKVPLTPGRQASYDEFREAVGEGLVDFATWCALTQVHGPSWETWPEELQDAHGPAVAAAREQLLDRVDLYMRLQWLLDEQLSAAQREACAAGMRVGVVHDLAVGVHPEGADSWALRGVLAHDVNVGAPPDAFNQQGQDWSQPPWRPEQLAAAGYAPYRDMLRTVLRHAGGIRIDHVIGLFRLWWVPRDTAPSEGAYVRYDHEALVGILALEAHRAGAFVIGEDLGTVEPWVRDYLGSRGILGTSILWFEKDDENRPLPPERWRRLCLASVTTHDLPPTAGYLAHEHVRIRSELGLLTRSAEEERSLDEADQAAFLRELHDRGLIDGTPTERQVVEALHRLVVQSPAALVGVAVPDLVGDRRTMNQPGTDKEYPNWRLPLAGPDRRPMTLEELAADERARSLASAVSTLAAPVR